MHILFWRKNEKFRKSRNNQNSFFKKLTSLTKKPLKLYKTIKIAYKTLNF
jgi:hypothetical protein